MFLFCSFGVKIASEFVDVIRCKIRRGLHRSGIRNVNRVSCTEEATSIFPPWARAISEAM